MSSISSLGSNNPYLSPPPVARTGATDADGDNDASRSNAANTSGTSSQPQPPKPTETLGNSINTYA